MKSLKTFWFIFFVLSTTLSYSQSNSFNKGKKLDLIEVIPVADKGFLFFKTDSIEIPTVLNFTYFNSDGDLIDSLNISTTRTDGLYGLEKIFVWKDKLIVCSSLYQPGFRRNHLLYYEYSLPNLNLTNSKVLLETIAPPTVYVPYFISLSPDSSKLLALGWNYTLPQEKAKVQAKVYDRDLTEVRKVDYNFDFENKRIALNEAFIDDANKIYLIGNNYRGRVNGYISPLKLDHFVLGLFPNENGKLSPIKREKHHFEQLKYALNKNQQLVGTGYYTKGLKAGIGLINFSETLVANISTHPIGYKDFRAAYYKNLSNFSAPSNDFSGYELTHLLCKDDAYYALGENHHAEGFYDDILVTKFTKKGELSWLSRIPKRQDMFGEAEKFASFVLVERKDKLYFLFNDNALNYTKKRGNDLHLAESTTSNSAISVLSLSTEKLERGILPDLLHKGYLLVPEFCHPINNQEVIVIGSGINAKKGPFSFKKITVAE